jgi:hypothetical protein
MSIAAKLVSIAASSRKKMITENSNSLTTFALAAGQGRTREPLDILGVQALVKLTNADTDGTAPSFI